MKKISKSEQRAIRREFINEFLHKDWRIMNTILARYEVGVEEESQEHFRLWSDASVRAVAIGGYVYDRMARVGKPQLWQAFNGDLIVQAVRLPNTVCTPTDCGLPASDSLSTPAAISG